MGMKDERLFSLALSHARLKAGRDLIEWSMTSHTEEILSRSQVAAILKRIKELEDLVWHAMRSSDALSR